MLYSLSCPATEQTAAVVLSKKYPSKQYIHSRECSICQFVLSLNLKRCLLSVGAVDGEAGGRAAGEENAWKFRQEQHVLRVVLQLLPRKAGLSAGGLPRPLGPSRVHLFHGKPVVGRGGRSSRLAQRVLTCLVFSNCCLCFCDQRFIIHARTKGWLSW